MSLNVNPDLSHYDGIVACGLDGYAATSLHDLGVHASMSDVDRALYDTFATAFGTSGCGERLDRRALAAEHRELEDSAQMP